MPSSTPKEPPPHLDPAAWIQLIEGFGPAILVVISSSMGGRLEQHLTAEDIWQETLFMAWRDRDKHEWHSQRAYRAWLITIARNFIRNAADHINAKKRGGDHQVDPFSVLLGSRGGSSSALLPPASTTPSRVAAHREMAAAMEDALHGLPDNLEQVLRLRLFEDLPMREVAARLRIALSTAKDRFVKGARLYRQCLQACLGTRPEQGAREA